jgi:hypothetical protein
MPPRSGAGPGDDDGGDGGGGGGDRGASVSTTAASTSVLASFDEDGKEKVKHKPPVRDTGIKSEKDMGIDLNTSDESKAGAYTRPHFSAQLEPCLTHKNALHTLNTP